MHIVQLGKYYPPHRGGIERAVEDLCLGLVHRGHDVTVVVSNENAERQEETRAGVRIIRLPQRLLIQSQPINSGLIGALRELDADVLHVHTPNPVGAVAALLARQSARALVVTHHSDIVRQRLLGAAGYLAHRALYARADAVVAATPLQLRYSKLLQAFRQKCEVIPFPARASAAAEEVQLPPGLNVPFALFVGRLVYYKGLDVLLEALGSCADLRLAVVGDGPERERLLGRVRAARLDERVIFLGDVAEDTLQALYAACRFLVLPSVAVSEAFGLVQLEAMARGRPVISTNLRSGVPYVNQHGRTGLLVPPGDVRALAAAMQELARDDALCARLGLAAKRRVEQEFDENTVLQRWLALYERVRSGR